MTEDCAREAKILVARGFAEKWKFSALQRLESMVE